MSPVKYWHLIWSNLKRKKLRTILTLLSIVVAFILFGFLSAIKQALAAGGEVAVDWSQAERVCAGALQVLLALGTAVHARGFELSVAGDNPGVRHTLELAGLSRLFPVRQDTP